VDTRAAGVGDVEAAAGRARRHVVRVVAAERRDREPSRERVCGRRGAVDVHLVVAASVAQHEQLGVEQGHAADALARPRLVQHHHLCKVKAKFHYTDTGPTRTRTKSAHVVGPDNVRGLCPCPCPCRARVRVRVVEFSYKVK